MKKTTQRIIKFRFWHRFEKKMYKVYNLKGDSATGTLCSLDLDIEKKPCAVENGKLMQYTGLKDKHEKEIYEGDIVKTPDSYDKCRAIGMRAGEINEIYFAYGGFRLIAKYNKKAKGDWLEDNSIIEVIGNIFEHKHLLNETKKNTEKPS